MQRSRPKIVLLHASSETDSYSLDWLDAFLQFPAIDAVPIHLNELKTAPALLKKEMERSDFIVALHSTNTNPTNIRNYMVYMPILLKRKVPLITFVGNEYNIPFNGCRLGEKIRLFNYLRPEILCTQLPLASAQKLYACLQPYTQVQEYPHALNEKLFTPYKKQSDRKIDLGIKTGRYGNYLGDDERNRIVDYFRSNAASLGLTANIENASNSKVGRNDWVEFLNSCKGTIGNESGTFFTEPDDHTVVEIMHYVRKKMGLKKQPAWFAWYEKMLYNYHPLIPYRFWLWLFDLFNTKLFFLRFAEYNLYSAVSEYNFQEIFEHFFRNYQNPVSTRCISSRHFDAIGTKTCQILFDGEYNSILKANEHYIHLKTDFSNIEEAVHQFKDETFRTKLVDSTYAYICDKHRYVHRVERFCQEILMK